MTRRRILLASSNAAKLRELQQLTGDLPYRMIAPGELTFSLPAVDEDGATFVENACKKALSAARACREAAEASLWTLADDSGLVVDALGGAPGVRSARFAGAAGGRTERDAANNALLLHRLQDVPEAQRTARFICALAVADGDEILMSVEGTVEGRILRQPRGGGGFGYDPLFFHPPSGRSFAELTPSEKAAVSHRGQALARLYGKLSRGAPERR